MKKFKQVKIDNETLKKIKSIDNTQTKKYVTWLSKQYINEPFDIDSIKSYIEEYGVLVNRKLIDADIYTFKSLDEFKISIDKVNNTKSASRKELETDYDVLVNDDRLLLIRPNTFEASRKLGLSVFKYRNNEETGHQDSAWCTTYSNRDHWDNYFYKYNVTFYYCMIKDEKFLEELEQEYYKNELNLVAIAVYKDGSLEIYDADDNQINDIENLISLLNIVEYLNPHKLDKRNIKKQKNNYDLLQQEVIDGDLYIDRDFLADFNVNIKCKIINGDVRISCGFIPKFFYNIIINGTFSCSHNKLVTLTGAPKEVNGSFVCNSNKLEDLGGSPEIVNGSFHCYNNQLITLTGAPKEINGSFDCDNNLLTSLEGMPKGVIRYFSCSNNKLVTLNDAPKEVNESFNCSNNELITLEGSPEKVNGYFDCSNNKLTTLEGAPKEVNGYFACSRNSAPFLNNDVLMYSNVTSSILL